MQRNTAARDKHRKIIARNEPPCALCGQPIDYMLRYPHPDSYVLDHIRPLHKGGTDDLANKQPSHRRCNSAKAARIESPVVKRSQSLTWPRG